MKHVGCPAVSPHLPQPEGPSFCKRLGPVVRRKRRLLAKELLASMHRRQLMNKTVCGTPAYDPPALGIFLGTESPKRTRVKKRPFSPCVLSRGPVQLRAPSDHLITVLHMSPPTPRQPTRAIQRLKPVLVLADQAISTE